MISPSPSRRMVSRCSRVCSPDRSVSCWRRTARIGSNYVTASSSTDGTPLWYADGRVALPPPHSEDPPRDNLSSAVDGHPAGRHRALSGEQPRSCGPAAAGSGLEYRPERALLPAVPGRAPSGDRGGAADLLLARLDRPAARRGGTRHAPG